MKMILIRHGETYANELFNLENERILIGALNTDITLLNDTGKKQALNTHEILKGMSIDEIYCSDLRRTIETTKLIFPHRDFHQTSLLRERCLGCDEGKKAVDVFSDPSSWKCHVDVDKDTIEECMTKKVVNGENYQDVFHRCQEFLNQFDVREEKTIAVVAHFHLIRCMIYVLLGKEPDKNLFQLMIPNAFPLEFDYEESGFVYHQINSLCLVVPSMYYKKDLESFRQEIIEAKDRDAFAGCGYLEDYENIEEWMNQVKLRESEKTLPEGVVPSNVYLAIRTLDHQLIGMIDLRHHINHPILQVWGGHIGYSVRPSERHKGYAKEMLRLDLIKAKELGLDQVMITCSSSNPASRQVILDNGGIFEKTVEVHQDIIERYWIKL